MGRLRNFFGGFLLAAVGTVFTGMSAQAADLGRGVPDTVSTSSTVVFSGVSAKEDSWYTYLGAVHAFNGNIGADGWLLRGFLGYGEYEYSIMTGVLAPGVDVDFLNADLTVGYQWFSAAHRTSVYAGVNYQDRDLSPNDPSNSTRGDEFGAKVQGEVESINSPFYYGVIGGYSTAHDDYWVRGRLGHRRTNLTIGPEIIVMGNEEYDQQRYGGFVQFGISSTTSVGVSAGWAETSGKGGDDSAYGSLNFSFAF